MYFLVSFAFLCKVKSMKYLLPIYCIQGILCENAERIFSVSKEFYSSWNRTLAWRSPYRLVYRKTKPVSYPCLDQGIILWRKCAGLGVKSPVLFLPRPEAHPGFVSRLLLSHWGCFLIYTVKLPNWIISKVLHNKINTAMICMEYFPLCKVLR